jgi:hypothetical protein
MKKQQYKIFDGSWSYKVNENGLEHEYGIAMKNRKYIIIAEDCVLPAYVYPFSPDCQVNNCIVKDMESGDIIFTQKRFLREVKMCLHCGSMIK